MSNAHPPAFELSHARVCELVDRFERHAKDRYLQSNYQEAEVRKDFIDPLLKALDWDVDHDREHNPYEQEVKVERAVTVARAHKRADYAFYLAPNFRDVRFFVEAKKPSVDLNRRSSDRAGPDKTLSVDEILAIPVIGIRHLKGPLRTMSSFGSNV